MDFLGAVATGSRELNQRQAWRILLCLIICAFILRLYNISEQSLWIDEAYTWNVTKNVHQVFTDVGNPPIYYILEYLWTLALGHSEAALRFPSLLYDLGSILLLFALGCAVTTRFSALLASAIATFSSFHVYYSQEARSMALYTLIVLAATIVLIKALRQPERTRLWVCYAVLAALGLYTHFIVVYFLFGHAVYALLAWHRGECSSRTLARFAASGAAAFLAFLPWLIRGLSYASQGGQARRHLLLKLPQAYFSFLFGDSLIPLDEQAVQHIRATLEANAPYLGLALLAVACLAVLLLFWKGGFRLGGPFPRIHFVLATVPPLACWLVSFKIPMFDERYFLAATPYLYLAVADVLTNPSRLSPRFAVSLRAAAVTTLAGLAAVSLANYYFSPRIGKEQWRDVARDIEAASGGADRTALVFDADYVEVAYRYYETEAMAKVLVTPKLWSDSQSKPRLLLEPLDGTTDLWLILSHNRDDRVREFLAEHFDTVASKSYPRAHGITVVHFQPRMRTPAETAAGAGRGL